MQSPTQTTMNYNEIIENWQNDEAKDMAQKLVEKYGPPNDVSRDSLTWYNNGPWEKTIIRDISVPHNFPKPHKDFLWQWASYRVNIDKACDCYNFDGSSLLDPTFGLIGGRCHMETANFITTNMVYEIMEGKRTWQDAQMFMAKTMMSKEPENYLNSLVFEPQSEDQARNPAEKADMSMTEKMGAMAEGMKNKIT